MNATEPKLPVRRIYRWDLDKTYLATEFDTFRQLVRTAFQKAHEKKAIPGARPRPTLPIGCNYFPSDKRGLM